MGSSVADAYVTLIPSFRGGSRAIGDALGNAPDTAGREAGSRYGSGFTGGLKSSLIGITSVLGGMLAFRAGSAVFDTVKESVVGFNSTLQQSGIAFTTLLGNGRKAQTFLGQLQAFAKATPFEFEGLVSNSQLLLGMGISARDLIPDLTALGDSVASVGGSSAVLNNTILAFGQTMAKGTLDMGNMNQLLQGGIPNALKILAASYHVTTGAMVKMISAGKVQSADALPRLIKGIEQGTGATAALGGMMNKQSQTFAGAMSNIHDALTQTLAKAGKPFFDYLTNKAQNLATLLSSASVEQWAKGVASGARNALAEVAKLKATGRHYIDEFFDGFRSGDAYIAGRRQLIPSIGAGAATALLRARQAATDFFDGFVTGAGQIGSRSSVFTSIGASASKVFDSAKTQGLKVFSATVQSLTKSAQVLKPYLDQLFAQFGPTLQALLPSLFVLAQAFNPVSLILHALLPVLPVLADALGRVAVALASALLPILPPLVAALAQLDVVLMRAFVVLDGGFLQAVAHLAVVLAPLAPYMVGLFAAFKAYQAAKTATTAVAGFYRTATGVTGILPTLRANVGAAGTVFAGYGRNVRTAGSVVAGWGRSVASGISSAASLVKSLAIVGATYLKVAAQTVISTGATIAAKAAQLALAAASKAWAAAQWLLNAALAANPIVLIVAGLALLVGGFILAYNKVGWFRAGVQAAFGGVLAIGRAMWTGITVGLHGISVAASAVIGFVRANWPLIVGIFLGPVGIVLALFVKFRSQITRAVSAAMSAVRSAFSAGLSAAVGLARGAVGSLGSLVAGIPGVFGRAFGAVKGAAVSEFKSTIEWVRGIPGGIVRALGAVDDLLVNAGKAILDGFLRGLTSKFEEVKHFVGGIAGWIQGHKGPLSYDRQLLVPHGKAVMAGFQAGLQQGFTRVQGDIATFTNGLRRNTSIASAANTLTSAAVGILAKFRGESATIAGLRSQNLAIGNLTRDRAAVASKLNSANQALVAAQTQLRDKAASIRDGILSAFNIAQTGGADGQRVTFASMLADLKAQAAQAVQFQADLADLRGKGLNATLLDQIAQAGPAQAAVQAAALVSASKTDIAQVNAQFALISKAASQAGAIDASAMYQSGVNAALGLVRGLQSQEKAIDQQMQRMGAKLVASIRQALGIRSPARKLIPVGEFVPLGLAKGIENRTKDIVKAASGMAEAATPKIDPPFVPTARIDTSAMQGRGLGAGPTVHAPITVAGVDDPIGAANAVGRRLAHALVVAG